MGIVNGQYIQGNYTLADLSTILGYNSSHLAEIIAKGDINKFARYKAVKHPTVEPITEAQRRSVAHGIIIPDVVTGSAITGTLIMDAAGNDWEYDQPTMSDMCRQADFRCERAPLTSPGYNKYAVPPIQCVYPKDGWTFMRGSTSRGLLIYFDLDPANDTESGDSNLQATDFVAGGLDLNDWKLVLYIDDPGGYLSSHLFESDDKILDNGEIAGNTIFIPFPGGTGSFSLDVYVAMYRYKDGQYELLPLPKQGDYNPAQMTLKVIDDPQATGGGLGGDDTEAMFKNVGFSYALDGTYKTAWDATDNGTAKWSLGTNGDLYISMNLTNKSGASKTIYRQDFTLDLNGDTPSRTPTTLFNAQKTAVSSVTIANGATATVYMYFQNIFGSITPASDWNSSNINSDWSMDMARAGATLFGGDIYAHKNGSQGWYQR